LGERLPEATQVLSDLRLGKDKQWRSEPLGKVEGTDSLDVQHAVTHREAIDIAHRC
jgi:hypothetical protein